MAASVERTYLDPGSAEYQAVAKNFNSPCIVNTRKCKLLSIEKVRNATLEYRFLAKKLEYEQTYGHVEIVKGWHGTKKANVASILQRNFDISKHGQSRGHRFGAGVSFSKLSSYAYNFCGDPWSTEACMLLADVLVSNVVQVPENTNPFTVLRVPPLLPGSDHLRFDTTAKNKSSMNVFVKFDADSFLPTHVVHFQRGSFNQRFVY